MDNVFCTLFDSNYIDKGLVLYDSMKECMDEFRLYVFAFDELCYELLKKENCENMVVVPLEKFESPELLKVKAQRTRAEYCWTCSSWSIKYVLDVYGESICTYIDADMRFFSSPQPAFEAMRAKNCSIIIVPHRFESEKEERIQHERVGSYCVEFNTFVNDANGLKALNWWADRCLEWCYYVVPGTAQWYGDQKYLNEFSIKFDGVYVCDHFGVGLAPWNIKLVTESNSTGCVPQVKVKKTGEEVPIVLYHFESTAFISKHILHVPSETRSKKLHREVFNRYAEEIIKKREYLSEKYGYHFEITRRTVTADPLMRIYQKYILPFRRIKHLADVYWVKGK